MKYCEEFSLGQPQVFVSSNNCFYQTKTNFGFKSVEIGSSSERILMADEHFDKWKLKKFN